jgi:hypothetical protein
MANQELIYDFINRFNDSNMFSDNIKFDYQLTVSERCIIINFHVKFSYEKLITNNDYINSNDIKSHFYKIKNDIKKYGFLKENQSVFSRVFFESDDEKIWNKKVLEKIIKPRIREIGDGSIHGISFKRGDDDLYPRIKITFKSRSRHNIRRYVITSNIREMLTKEFNLHPNISVNY